MAFSDNYFPILVSFPVNHALATHKIHVRYVQIYNLTNSQPVESKNSINALSRFGFLVLIDAFLSISISPSENDFRTAIVLFIFPIRSIGFFSIYSSLVSHEKNADRFLRRLSTVAFSTFLVV